MAMDARGAILRTIECDAAPLCLSFGKDGLLYAGLTDHVVVFNTEGKLIAQWDKPSNNALLTSLAVAGDYLFAADAANKVVLRYTLNGVVSLKMGQKNADRNWPGFVIPSPYSFNLALAPDGLLRIVNPGRHWVEAWTIDGHREWRWGETSFRLEGFSGCCNPAAIAILLNGHIITSEKGLIRMATRWRESSGFKTTLRNAPLGTKVEIGPILGNFVLPDDASRPLVFIAGGIGITPFMSMLRYVEEEHSCKDTSLTDCKVTGATNVTEIFRFQGGKWVY